MVRMLFSFRSPMKHLMINADIVACLGDLMYINAFGQGGVLVANSVGAVVDLFDRRGSVYRHRPPWIGT